MQILIRSDPRGATGLYFELRRGLIHFPNFDLDKCYGHWSKISPHAKQPLG